MLDKYIAIHSNQAKFFDIYSKWITWANTRFSSIYSP